MEKLAPTKEKKKKTGLDEAVVTGVATIMDKRTALHYGSLTIIILPGNPLLVKKITQILNNMRLKKNFQFVLFYSICGSNVTGTEAILIRIAEPL